MLPDRGEGLYGSKVYCKSCFNAIVTLFDLLIYSLTKLRGQLQSEIKKRRKQYLSIGSWKRMCANSFHMRSYFKMMSKKDFETHFTVYCDTVLAVSVFNYSFVSIRRL